MSFYNNRTYLLKEERKFKLFNNFNEYLFENIYEQLIEYNKKNNIFNFNIDAGNIMLFCNDNFLINYYYNLIKLYNNKTISYEHLLDIIKTLYYKNIKIIIKFNNYKTEEIKNIANSIIQELINTINKIIINILNNLITKFIDIYNDVYDNYHCNEEIYTSSDYSIINDDNIICGFQYVFKNYKLTKEIVDKNIKDIEYKKDDMNDKLFNICNIVYIGNDNNEDLFISNTNLSLYNFLLKSCYNTFLSNDFINLYKAIQQYLFLCDAMYYEQYDKIFYNDIFKNKELILDKKYFLSIIYPIMQSINYYNLEIGGEQIIFEKSIFFKLKKDNINEFDIFLFNNKEYLNNNCINFIKFNNLINFTNIDILNEIIKQCLIIKNIEYNYLQKQNKIKEIIDKYINIINISFNSSDKINKQYEHNEVSIDYNFKKKENKYLSLLEMINEFNNYLNDNYNFKKKINTIDYTKYLSNILNDNNINILKHHTLSPILFLYNYNKFINYCIYLIYLSNKKSLDKNDEEYIKKNIFNINYYLTINNLIDVLIQFNVDKFEKIIYNEDLSEEKSEDEEDKSKYKEKDKTEENIRKKNIDEEEKNIIINKYVIQKYYNILLNNILIISYNNNFSDLNKDYYDKIQILSNIVKTNKDVDTQYNIINTFLQTKHIKYISNLNITKENINFIKNEIINFNNSIEQYNEILRSIININSDEKFYVYSNIYKKYIELLNINDYNDKKLIIHSVIESILYDKSDKILQFNEDDNFIDCYIEINYQLKNWCLLYSLFDKNVWNKILIKSDQTFIIKKNTYNYYVLKLI